MIIDTNMSKEKMLEIIRELSSEVYDLRRLKAISNGKILAVEDGSVNIDKLEEDGFYVIPYRQGAIPPILLQPKTMDKE